MMDSNELMLAAYSFIDSIKELYPNADMDEIVELAVEHIELAAEEMGQSE